jgi:uncharacterized cupredoxin-like copper-binding protein
MTVTALTVADTEPRAGVAPVSASEEVVVSSYRLRICIAVLAIAVLAPATAAARPSAAVVKVTAGKPSEFRFTLSTHTVKKGTVTFSVVNKGSIPHDFHIDGKTTALLQAGKSATLKITFKKAGSYPYECTVPGHAAAGMKGVLKVT